MNAKRAFTKAVRKSSEWDDIQAAIDAIPDAHTRGYMDAQLSRFNGVLDGKELAEELICEFPTPEGR